MLRPGERILWEGRPDVRTYSLRGAWYLIPFSILWGGFAIFWEVTAIASGGGVFALWGVPFVAIGLYMIFGRLLVARREAANTAYALTDRRIVILTGAFRQVMQELDLRDLPMAQVESAGGGLGTITFGATSGAFRAPPGWPMAGMYGRPPAITAVPDAGRLFEMIQDAKAEARRAP